MTSLQCPVCKAGDNSALQCRRCKADLSLLWRLERTRAAACAAAKDCANRGDWDNLVRHAWNAHQLRPGADTAGSLAACCLLHRDFARALALHQRASVPGERRT